MAAPLPRVLFICQSGTVKSAIARELFRERAKERGMEIAVVSRGIAIEDHVTPQLKARLDAHHLDPAREHPLQLQQSDLEHADVVVFFDSLPAGLHKAGMLDWSGQPSFLNTFDQAMPYLRAHIDRLLDTIDRDRKGKAIG